MTPQAGQFSRVRLMATGDPTWDLNDDDVAAISAVLANHAALLAALKGLVGDIDSGLLVRDIALDGKPGWSMHMLAFVQRLSAAQIAIADAEMGS